MVFQEIPPADLVRSTVDGILRSQEFKPDTTETLLLRLLQLFQQMLAYVANLARNNPDTAWGVAVLLGLVLVGLCVHIGITVWREWRSMTQPSSRRQTSIHKALEGLTGDAQSAWNLAHDAFVRGDLYRSLWVAHRLTLGLLDGTGTIVFERWKTNTDYLRECPDTHPAATPLREITTAYENVIYAHKPEEPGRVERLLDWLRGYIHDGAR